MPTSYTSLLGLALPVTGELSGTWGDTVNDYITQYLDASVAGTQTISGSQTAVTLSKTTAVSLSQAGSGATGSSQYNIINCTGNPASMLTVTVPAASKTYVVVNATSTNQDVKIVGAGPTTGVTLVAGEKAVIAWNGSDFIKVATSTADGVTTFSAGTTGFTPSTATSGAVTLAGTLATTNGGTGLTSFTANGVVYASSSSALTTGSALTFDGTNLGVGTSSPTSYGASYSVLEVAGSTSGVINVKSGSTLYGQISNSPNEFKIDAVGASSSLVFLRNTTEGMRLTSTGLGIGTSSPAAYAKLTVSGTAGVQTGASQQIVINAPTTTAGQGAGIRFNAASGANEAVGVIGLINEASGNSGAMTFHVYNAGANIPEYMRLSSLGNLGIGTDAPATKLVLATPDSSTTGQLRFARSADVSYFWEIGRDNNLTGDFIFSNASGGAKTERMRLDSSGNLGLGVTPSASWANYKVLQIGEQGVISGFASGAGVLNTGANFYWDGSGYRYLTTNAASLYQQNAGAHNWRIAPSGTAGDTISFTQAMTLDASGNLIVADTSPAYSFSGRGNITIGGTSGSILGFRINSVNKGYIYHDGTNLDVNNQANGYLSFATNNTERARITNVGNFSLGTHADRGTTVGTNALQIFNGTAPAGTLTNGVSLYSSSGDLFFMDAAGNASRVGFRGVPQSGSAKTGSYTLATTDVGDYIQVGSGGSITIPDATFATGDVVSIFNNTTGNITITCSITTAYIAGTDSDKATMTLATRGVATVLFISSTVCVVTGNVT